MERITIDKALAEKYNGKCYLDSERPSYIEAIRFIAKPDGLDTQFIGCSYCDGYNNTLHDDFGTFYLQRTFCGDYLHNLEKNIRELQEISIDKFDEICNFVNTKIEEVTKEKNDFLIAKENILQNI